MTDKFKVGDKVTNLISITCKDAGYDVLPTGMVGNIKYIRVNPYSSRFSVIYYVYFFPFKGDQQGDCYWFHENELELVDGGIKYKFKVGDRVQIFRPVMPHSILNGEYGTILPRVSAMREDTHRVKLDHVESHHHDKGYGFFEHELKLVEENTIPRLKDKINSPDHYKFNIPIKEVIDVIRDRCNLLDAADLGSSYRGRLYGDCIKYLLRFPAKNGIEDLKKCRKYLDWLIEDLDNGN